MFTLTENGIIPVHNAMALGKDQFRMCGKVLATGIVHGAQSPVCFAPEAAHFLVYGTSAKRNAAQMLTSIPDAEIQYSLQQVCVAHAQQLLCTSCSCMQAVNRMLTFMHSCFFTDNVCR